MSETEVPISPLAPDVSPLAEADPNSINELIQQRIDDIFNKPPALLTDEDLKFQCEYYRRERARFLIESQTKPVRATTRRKAPTSVKEALESSSDLF